MESKLARCLIKDILSSKEYTLRGIACYTQSPEEVIYDVAIGSNTNPSAMLLRKIIELHRLVRPGLYLELMQKITKEISMKETKSFD